MTGAVTGFPENVILKHSIRFRALVAKRNKFPPPYSTKFPPNRLYKMNNTKNIKLLNEVGINDIELVGGKNASLGEMLQNLTPLGVQVPCGFVITVDAYRHFISSNELDIHIAERIAEIDYNNIESLRRAGLQIRSIIRNARFPKELSEAIIDAYSQLSKQYDQDATDVAVRSSATAEDLPDASFAGQQETYLNVRGPVSYTHLRAHETGRNIVC